MKLLTEDEALAPFLGKRVAVVGNGMSIQLHNHGAVIDEHDLVVRMNLGIPEVRGALHDSIGRRTDILTAGKAKFVHRALGMGAKPQAFWFLKAPGLTPNGDEDWRRLTPAPWTMFRFPREWEDEVHRLVGCAPSTGPRMLWAACKGEAASISAFGFDFFGHWGSDKSWYKVNKAGPPPHDGGKEAAFFLEMGFEEKERGWWVL